MRCTIKSYTQPAAFFSRPASHARLGRPPANPWVCRPLNRKIVSSTCAVKVLAVFHVQHHTQGWEAHRAAVRCTIKSYTQPAAIFHVQHHTQGWEARRTAVRCTINSYTQPAAICRRLHAHDNACTTNHTFPPDGVSFEPGFSLAFSVETLCVTFEVGSE